MGDRGQVKMKQSGVYLYTHWGGSELLSVVKQAIAKGLRWDNEEYLTRIIFDEMTKGQTGEETGFGIGTQKHGDIEHDLIIVDCENQIITFEEDSFGNKSNNKSIKFSQAKGGVD